MVKKIMKNKQAFAIMLGCLIMFLVMFVFGIIIMVWLFAFGGLASLGQQCLLFVLPIFLIVIMGILAKKYLFTGGKKE